MSRVTGTKTEQEGRVLVHSRDLMDFYVDITCTNCWEEKIPMQFNYHTSVTAGFLGRKKYDKRYLDSILERMFPLEENEILITCKKCGGLQKFVSLDHNISNIICKLNKKGYETAYCCSGHDYHDKAYISFSTGEREVRNKLIDAIVNLPYDWTQEILYGSIVIRHRHYPMKFTKNGDLKESKTYLSSIDKWVEELEPLK